MITYFAHSTHLLVYYCSLSDNEQKMVMKNLVRDFKILDSTNLYLKRKLMVFPDRSIVIAEQQTKGRGKGSSQWLSTNKNNLYASVLLKGSSKLNTRLSELTQFFTIIAAQRIEKAFSGKILIKYPNDLMVSNKKVGGILAESIFSGSRLVGTVLGIGLNFQLTLSEKEKISQPSTSLSDNFSKVVNKDKLTQDLFQDFFDQWEDFLEIGSSLYQDQLIRKLLPRTN
jgi:BirA family biotin operon repressor/biotin-[acetyl-CoA-carboxylase] ligase